MAIPLYFPIPSPFPPILHPAHLAAQNVLCMDESASVLLVGLFQLLESLVDRGVLTAIFWFILSPFSLPHLFFPLCPGRLPFLLAGPTSSFPYASCGPSVLVV